MANNLKKIRGLTYSRELNDRVGVAMFLYAKNLDQGGDAAPEDKKLAQWAIANPMGVDNTMLALVATDTAIVDSSTVVEAPASNGRSTGNSAVTPGGNPGYAPSDVSLDNVSDEDIEAAVAANWNKVAQKYKTADPVDESVTVGPGQPGRNPFLGGPVPSSAVVDDQLIKGKPDQ